MPDFMLPSFGRLDPNSLEEYYEAALTFNNRQIQLDLNFEKIKIEPARLEMVNHFIENIRIYDLNNKGYLNEDYMANGDAVQPYLQHHLEELGKEELSELIDVSGKSSEHEKQLLKKLQLIRVGIYPDNATIFAAFDYSIGKDITDQMLVIFTDENGNLDNIAIES